MGDTHAWLSVEPDTVRERLVAGAVVDALRRLALAGLGRACTIQVRLQGREIDVCVYHAASGHAMIPQGGDATE